MRSETFVVCLDNQDYPASLERHKLYRQLPDAAGEKLRMIRLVDESGEDYLYPSELFAPIEIPLGLRRQLRAT
jgi:hypothetical protein